MLHVCAIRFDVTENLEIFWKLNEALVLDFISLGNVGTRQCRKWGQSLEWSFGGDHSGVRWSVGHLVWVSPTPSMEAPKGLISHLCSPSPSNQSIVTQLGARGRSSRRQEQRARWVIRAMLTKNGALCCCAQVFGDPADSGGVGVPTATGADIGECIFISHHWRASRSRLGFMHFAVVLYVGVCRIWVGKSPRWEYNRRYTIFWKGN